MSPRAHPRLEALEAFARLGVLRWPDRDRRDLPLRRPHDDGAAQGTFAPRTPVRHTSIGTSPVRLVRVEGAEVDARARLPRRHAAPECAQ